MDPYKDILFTVSRPSRYLGGEAGSIRKDWKQASLRVCLAFPDLYEVGTSHFGMQILYHLANRMTGVLAERAFLPAPDMERALVERGLPLFSLENRRPLSEFDLLGFSLLYELNYPGMLAMLSLAGIPLYAADREPEHPVVIGGGPCMVNPEPVADFLDAVVVGEAEEVFPAMLAAMETWKAEEGDKQDLLRAWSQMEGVYVPSFFAPGPDGMVSRQGAVTRAVVRDLDGAPFPRFPVVPWGRPVHDRLRLEIARGCGRGCRFCQAGMIYRPFRERSASTVACLAEECLANTGYEDLSLLSLSVGDHSQIGRLLSAVMDRCTSRRVGVSFPSVRADTLTADLMEQIKRVRKTGFTIAPEAGSHRLRDVINKNVDEPMVHKAVKDAFALGWRLVKLYFMIGLPTETDEDVAEIANMVLRLKKAAGNRANITASIGVFVPKPHTPFQWAGQISVPEARRKIEYLKDRLRKPGIKVKWHNPEVSRIEGVVSRGGRETARLLVRAFELGARLDGWSDHFDPDLWQRAMEETGVGLVPMAPDLSAPLPWDHIDVRVSRDFLLSEWKRALEGRTTPGCAQACAKCGVCDFVSIAPRPAADRPVALAAPRPEPEVWKKVEIAYTKTGPARFLGHLEMMNALLRALSRAGVDLKYSQGYHPLPKVSFGDALPLFAEGTEERLWAQVAAHTDPGALKSCLNAILPPGMEVIYCGSPRPPDKAFTYRVEAKEPLFSPDAARAFERAQTLPLARTDKKGRVREVDLKKAVAALFVESETVCELTLRLDQDLRVKPEAAVRRIFSLGDEAPLFLRRRPGTDAA
ncbi:MAG: TIGR03960 family B12-binding radical SAM protein [Deltaproteobacteria bacterium]|nr:TIGR03960 family B12-binding radical SAM protein [Deltaproteobacteria bacterium]